MTLETDHLESVLGTAAEMSHPTLWAFARKLERERNDAIEMMRRTRDNSGQIIASQANENILLTEQRDRMAEALQKVVTAWDFAEWLDENDFEAFRDTLQSLTTTEP